MIDTLYTRDTFIREILTCDTRRHVLTIATAVDPVISAGLIVLK